MHSYILAFIIQMSALVTGVGLAYLNDEYRIIDLFHIHDMGLDNLFTWIIIMGIAGAAINVHVFRAKKVILGISVFIVGMFLLFYWRFFLKY